MDARAEPQPDLSLLLPAGRVLHRPRGCAPAAGAAPDTPEARAHRDNAAIAQIAAMLPAMPTRRNSPPNALGSRARRATASARPKPSAATARVPEMPRAGRLLPAPGAEARLGARQSLQAERRQREADSAAADRAAWTEHCAIGLMADALGREPPAPIAEPPPVPQRRGSSSGGRGAAPDLIKEAELYAVMYPRRAALIRRHGRVPDNVSWGPPDDYLVPRASERTDPGATGARSDRGRGRRRLGYDAPRQYWIPPLGQEGDGGRG